MPPPHQPFAPQVHYQVANWIESLRQLGCSKEEAIEVLSQDDFPVGQFERQGKNYGNIPGAELQQLGKAFRLTVGSLPSSVKNLSETWRTLKWVNRQRTVPMARLKGERVRKRNPVRVRSGPELSVHSFPSHPRQQTPLMLVSHTVWAFSRHTHSTDIKHLRNCSIGTSRSHMTRGGATCFA